MATEELIYKAKIFYTFNEPPSPPWFLQNDKLTSGPLTESETSIMFYAATTSEILSFNWGTALNGSTTVFGILTYIGGVEDTLLEETGNNTGAFSVSLNPGDYIIFIYFQTDSSTGYKAWISIGGGYATMLVKGSKYPGKHARL